MTVPVLRIGYLLDRAREILVEHEAECGDYVVGFALHPTDFDAMSVAEMWGLPVFAYEEVTPKRVKLLCDRTGVMIGEIESFEDLLEHWTYDLRRPPDEAEAA